MKKSGTIRGWLNGGVSFGETRVPEEPEPAPAKADDSAQRWEDAEPIFPKAEPLKRGQVAQWKLNLLTCASKVFLGID